MPIGDAIAILQFTPLAITAGAALFLGDKVGWRRWLATCVGLVGVLIIVRPGGTGFNPYSVLALLSILFGVARDLLTRGMASSVPSLLIAGTSSAAVTLASLGFIAFETWTWPSSTTAPRHPGLQHRAGGGPILAHHRHAHRARSPWSRHSGIRLLCGRCWPAIWCGSETPDLASWVGIAIVTAAGLYTFLREQRLARAIR